MADALASGASVLRDVGVQVPLRPRKMAVTSNKVAAFLVRWVGVDAASKGNSGVVPRGGACVECSAQAKLSFIFNNAAEKCRWCD